jgi:hypothetical protein
MAASPPTAPSTHHPAAARGRVAAVAGRVRDGVAGNARITGMVGALLLVLLAAEGATIPFIGGLLGPHIFIGMVLVPPVALKLGSTGYRFIQYYRGTYAYRRKGPPALYLRLLGPLVVISSVALVGTGVALLVVGPPSQSLVFFHKLSFFVWVGAMTVHVLGHLLELPKLALPDWRRRGGRGGREAELAGAGMRIALLGTSLAAGLVLALATISVASPWLGG